MCSDGCVRVGGAVCGGLWEIFAFFRSHVLLPQTGDGGLVVIQSGRTETGTAGGKKGQQREDHPVAFTCFVE